MKSKSKKYPTKNCSFLHHLHYSSLDAELSRDWLIEEQILVIYFLNFDLNLALDNVYFFSSLFVDMLKYLKINEVL